MVQPAVPVVRPRCSKQVLATYGNDPPNACATSVPLRWVTRAPAATGVMLRGCKDDLFEIRVLKQLHRCARRPFACHSCERARPCSMPKSKRDNGLREERSL